MSFDVIAVRRQFPILSEIIDGRPVHYLDNGASAQTPNAVLDAVRAYETTSRANVLRGVHLGNKRGRVSGLRFGYSQIANPIYLLQKGTPDKPDWTVYSLRSNTSDSLESYLLQGDSLVPLGSDGQPIQAPFNLSLKKQP